MNIRPINLDSYVLLACLCLPFLSNSSNNPFYADFQQLQNTLKDRQVVLSYKLFAEKKTVKISVIEKYKIVEIEQPVSPNFSDDVQDFYRLIQNFSIIQKSNRLKFIERSHQFYQQLIEPVEKIIGSEKHLLIINKGVLQYLPFEILLPTKLEKPFNEMDFLIKKHTISYFTSIADLLQSKSYSNTSEALLAFAPVFQDENETATQNRSSGGGFSSFGEVKALPYSEIEAKELANLYQQSMGQNADLLLHGQANKSEFLRQTQKAYRFIHLATHSFADFKNSEKSGIVCSGGVDECAPVYEVLFAKELENRKITAELVVLSSCESGIGKLDKHEGVLGIHRSFMKAGCGNVLFSLWKVNDQVCQKFMKSFYTNIFDGKSYSDSLRLAKLDLLKSKTTASPNIWAAFLLMGD